jgi:hypothetical protein
MDTGALDVTLIHFLLAMTSCNMRQHVPMRNSFSVLLAMNYIVMIWACDYIRKLRIISIVPQKLRFPYNRKGREEKEDSEQDF